MLRFVRRALDLCFTVDRIAELLALWRDRSRRRADVKQLALSEIDGLRRKIREMEDKVATLAHLAHSCNGEHRPDCPIFPDLEGETSRLTQTSLTAAGFGRN